MSERVDEGYCGVGSCVGSCENVENVVGRGEVGGVEDGVASGVDEGDGNENDRGGEDCGNGEGEDKTVGML